MMPSDDSSSISNFGLETMARAIASICCSPPDIVSAIWCQRSPSPGILSKETRGDPKIYAAAKAAGKLNELPVNHSPQFDHQGPKVDIGARMRGMWR